MLNHLTNQKILLIGLFFCLTLLRVQATQVRAATPAVASPLSDTCPVITSTGSATVGICSGQPVPVLSLTTTATNPPYSIEFVSFTVAQANPYTATPNSGKTLLGDAGLYNATATLSDITFPGNNGPTPMMYYVYACLKPVPTDPACSPFASYTVVVSPNPVIKVTTSGVLSCLQPIVTVHATITNAGSPYLFTVNSGALQSSSSPTVSFPISTAGYYAVQVTGINGCTSSATAWVGQDLPKCVPVVVKKI